MKEKERDKSKNANNVSLSKVIYNRGKGKINDIKFKHITVVICINFSPQRDLGDHFKYLPLQEI